MYKPHIWPYEICPNVYVYRSIIPNNIQKVATGNNLPTSNTYCCFISVIGVLLVFPL